MGNDYSVPIALLVSGTVDEDENTHQYASK